MSGENDNVFARWSRRKLSVDSTELQATENENPSLDVAVEDAGAVPQATDQEPGPAQTETDEPAEPLPRIEDLTAESDLSAFLRKGVPMALKSAAMRKMWSLDPNIRDHVGLSEYAWDFNQPGSMAGFGPLDAKETVVGFLSKTISGFRGGRAACLPLTRCRARRDGGRRWGPGLPVAATDRSVTPAAPWGSDAALTRRMPGTGRRSNCCNRSR